MRLRPARKQRPALSLLEVLVAVAVLLFALIAIGRLISFGADRALDVQDRARATELCRTELDKVVAGVVPLSSQSNVPCDEDPDWNWSLTADQGSVSGLWTVTVTVSRQRRDGSRVEVVLNRMLVDPSLRGNLYTVPQSSTSSSSGSGASGNSSSSGQTTGSSGSGSGGSTPTAAAAAPATAARGTTTGTAGAARGSATPAASGGR